MSAGLSTESVHLPDVEIDLSAIGSFLFGYDSGIIGSVISPGYKQFHLYFNDPSDGIIGAIVSVFAGGACEYLEPVPLADRPADEVGSVFGALLAGQTADRFGRKRTIQLGATIAIIGCTLQTAAVNVSMLIVGRLIAGISIGVLSMIVPMYQAEISPPHARSVPRFLNPRRDAQCQRYTGACFPAGPR